MKVYVYPTDRDWYQYLSTRTGVDEVNFWRPGGQQPFRQLRPGDLFLFRFGKPDNAIVGGGTYTHFSFAPLFQAWDFFGEKNGTRDYDSFLRLIARHRRVDRIPKRRPVQLSGTSYSRRRSFFGAATGSQFPPTIKPRARRGKATTPVREVEDIFLNVLPRRCS